MLFNNTLKEEKGSEDRQAFAFSIICIFFPTSKFLLEPN